MLVLRTLRTVAADIILHLPRNNARADRSTQPSKIRILNFFPGFRRSPDRCAQENEVLDEELAGIPEHGKPVREMERSRSGEQKTHCEQESDDSSDAANERKLCRERPQRDEQSDNNLDPSDQIGNSLKAEDSIEPGHEAAARHQRLNPVGLVSGEFESANE